MFDIKHVYQDPVTATVVALGVTAGATVYSVDQQKAAARDQKRANEAQTRMQNIKTMRERRRQSAEAQRVQAQMQAQNVTTGTGQTSAASQASGSVQSQLAGNLSFLDSMQQLTNRQSIFMQKAADHSSNAATGQAVAGLSGQVASFTASPTGQSLFN